MPSLQQSRHEALAARVERARGAVAASIVGIDPEPLPARVERSDGSTVEFLLEEVQLDAAELRGRDARKHVVVIPLADVKRVWRRRLRPRPAGAVFLSIIAASALLPALLAPPFVPVSIETLAAGVLLGVPLCGGAWIVLRRLKSFQEWLLLYDRDATV